MVFIFNLRNKVLKVKEQSNSVNGFYVSDNGRAHIFSAANSQPQIITANF